MASSEEIYLKVKFFLETNAVKFSFNESNDSFEKLEKIFKTFWSHPTIRSFTNLPRPSSDISSKGNEISEKFRNEGNRLYKEKKFDKALIAYNYAVISASHPEICKSNSNMFNQEDISNESSSAKSNLSYECLSFAYSNRSAVLFEMGVYEHSKADIDRAISLGYPKSKSLKLVERNGKCLLNLGKQKEAEKIFKEILNAQKCDKNTNSQAILSLEKLLHSCNINTEKCVSTQNKKENFKNIFYRGSEVPLFINQNSSDPENKDYSYRSEAVDIQNSTTKGRHLVASRDIEPGEILIVEKAYCSILKLNKNLRLYCCVCMKSSPIVLPCPTCSLVVFCSEECRTNDRIHYLECSILPTLITLKLDEEVSLVFRTVCSFTLKNIIKELKENSKYSHKDGGPKLNNEFASTFQNLLQLEGNLGARSIECLHETAIYAVLVVQMLKQLNQFWNCEGESEIEDTHVLGGLVMRWILCFQCNIHCLKELLIDKKVNIISATANDIGYGLYCAFSLMNHSCVPNTLHSSWGDVKLLFSTSTIPKGEEIVDSYGERYASHDLETRQKNLQETYHFKCTCEACTENWPLFDRLPQKFSLKCIRCHKPLQPQDTKCQQCKMTSSNTIQSPKKSKKKKNKDKSGESVEVCHYEINDIQKQMKIAWSAYDLVYKELNLYKASFEGIKKVSKLLSLMDRYTVLPHKPYLEAQEVLLRSFDMFGSHFFIEEKRNSQDL